MIKSVTVTNHLGESVKIVLSEGDPEHGMIIKKIDGLGPAKANINGTELATNDGALYNSARLDKRNITLQIVLTEAPDIETSRQRSYKYFPIKKPVDFLIELDNRVARTTGYVESNEPDIFSQNEEISISLICHYPYFYSEMATQVTFYGVEPLFYFLFSNDSLDEDLLEFGEIQDKRERAIYYEGDSEVGITITMHALGEIRDIKIYNTGTREVMHIDTAKLETLTGAPFNTGEDIIVSTIQGNKYAKLRRRGRYINILNCVAKDSAWFRLSKGKNFFVCRTEYGIENLDFEIEYQTVYEGV